MSICSGIGNGIGGAIGKWGAGLGSALGLGAAVDVGVRAYTGYGLLETLSVPYIECPDGSYATAIEWYGSGLKCPKKPENIPSVPAIVNSVDEALDYDSYISALGGATSTCWGVYLVASLTTPGKILIPLSGGFFNLTLGKSDKFGNVWPTNYQEGSDGLSASSPISADFTYYWRNGSVNDGVFGGGWRTTKEQIKDFKNVLKSAPYKIIGRRTRIPETIDKAPAAAPLPKERGQFAPSPPPPKEDCEEMSCPCLTPDMIEKAVKKALGLTPFAPEKLIREMGAKMFAAPGPSLVPIVPLTLVDAIAAIQAASYMRAGYGRYPVMMPGSLINDHSIGDAVPTEPIENFAEWFEWFIKQFDAVIGEFPVEIEIKNGGSSTPLKFENVSEAIAEMTGLIIQTATDADAAVSCAAHAATAAVQATNAATIGQKAAECLIKFFGVRTGVGVIFVESPITPADTDSSNFSLKDFLKPSKQRLAILTDDDPFDFQAVCDRILRNTEIAKTAVAHDFNKGMIGDYTRNQRKYDEGEQVKIIKKEFKKLEEQITTSNKKTDFVVKIVVPKDLPNEIQGNNFVIKRKE